MSHVTISLEIDPEYFARLNVQASRHNKSLHEYVLEWLDAGLVADEDEDPDLP